jgi:hypothetical protein
MVWRLKKIILWKDRVIITEEADDPEAIATIWWNIQQGSRGIMGPESKVYTYCYWVPLDAVTKSIELKNELHNAD